jgi:alkanesulfonate monooxygenase SsuD/methylene tetrahydromethanopterin reductase-like flavin-dependent oxidoreductase (luciferase family)
LKFALDLPNMGAYGSAEQLAELALEAETAGWEGIFVWDSVHVDLEDPGNRATYDPWIALAAMAANTSRIRLGTMITPIARRRPWKLARETVTLDHLSGGRLILPVGLGAVEDGAFSKVGEEQDRLIRAQKLDEGLELLTGLWSGRPFSFAGDHFQTQEMTFLPPPVQRPRILIWVVGAWPRKKSMRRALRWDGILPIKMTADGQSLADEGNAQAGGMTPEDVSEMKAYVEQRRTQDGPFDIILEGETPGHGPAQAAAIVRPYAQAGATWWVEAIWKFFYSAPGDVEAVRQRIRQGPPRFD